MKSEINIRWCDTANKVNRPIRIYWQLNVLNGDRPLESPTPKHVTHTSSAFRIEKYWSGRCCHCHYHIDTQRISNRRSNIMNSTLLFHLIFAFFYFANNISRLLFLCDKNGNSDVARVTDTNQIDDNNT